MKTSAVDEAKQHFEVLLSAPKDLAAEVGELFETINGTLVKDLKMSNTLVDVVWMHTCMQQENGSGEEDLTAIVKAITSALPELRTLFLENLDASWLQTAGIVPTEAELQKKIRLTNTQQFYRQHKFNLMSEISEGYSKLLYFLSHQAQHQKSPDEVAEKINSLIGTFSLDPSRCLDIALDILEDCLSTATDKPLPVDAEDGRLEAITSTIRVLHTDKITAVLAFKLKERKDKKTVLRCVAYLFCRKMLDLIDMLTFFPEWVDPLQEMCKKRRLKEKKRIRALGRIRLSGSSAPAEEEEQIDLSSLETHFTTQLIFVFLEWNLFAEIENIFKDHWSDLCELFPIEIGSHICDFVEKDASDSFKELLSSIQWDEGGPDTEKVEAMDIDGSQKSASDVMRSIATRLGYTKESGCISLRPSLFCQLWRLVSCYLGRGEAKDECLSFVEEFLLPALSAFPSNPSINLEAWKAIKHFPCRTRYAWYGKWRGSGLGRDALSSDKPLWLIESELTAAKDARYALKRLSKDTIRETSRAIGKISHSGPLVVFSIMLSTIESYDNMIKVMVESMHYVAPLSLDVLCFCILNRLTGAMGGVNRSRLKEDGVNVSQWLQSLETFIGALCRQFPSLEIRGIISYLVFRLRKGEVMELGVLRTVLKTSGGWAFADYAPAASLSTAQLEGRAGSVLLKRETMSFGVFEDFSSRASAAIRKVLQTDNFGTTLLVLLAQVHCQLVFEGQGRAKPIKLIGNLVDSCQATMAILLDFLTDSAIERSATDGSPTDAAIIVAKSMPSLLDLIEKFELDVSSIWMICRPLVRAASLSNNDEAKMKEFVIQDDVRRAYMSKLPEHTWKEISCDLYESFYCHTLFDIFLPDDSYKNEIARLERDVDSKSRNKNDADTKTIERMKKVKADLSSDWNKQRHHVESIRNRIKADIESFFVSEEVTVDATTTFFTRCIFPRCMQGPDDAIYCAHFISMLHSLETPGFGTLQLYDLLIASLSRSVFGLTEGEAASVSILLEAVWKQVSHWRYDEDSFAEEVDGKVGSYVENDDGEMEKVTLESYSSLYNKWHASLGASMLGCLRSPEYMHCRNSLIVLSRMVEVYPTRPTLANRLVSALRPLQDESFPFADIRASAQAYNTQLVKARDEGVWKEETESAKKARKAKEKAEAVARQKKAKEQMEQIELDSQKITEEIGERDSYDRRQGRGGPRRDREDDRRGPPPPADRQNPPRDEKWARRSEAPSNLTPPNRRDSGRDEGGRKPEDRWPRGTEQPSRGGKRSRATSPAEHGEGVREEGASRSNKRQRTDSMEDGALPDDSGGRRGRKNKHSRR